METNCKDIKRDSILVTFYVSINEVFLITEFRTLELNWTCLDLALNRYSDTICVTLVKLLTSPSSVFFVYKIIISR